MAPFQADRNYIFGGEFNNVQGNYNKTYNGDYYDLRGSKSPSNVNSFNTSKTVIIDSFNNNDDGYGYEHLPQRRRNNNSGYASNPNIPARDRRRRPQYPDGYNDDGYGPHPPIPPHPLPRGMSSPGPQRPHKPRYAPPPTQQWPDHDYAEEQEPAYVNPNGFPYQQHKSATLAFDAAYGREPTPPPSAPPRESRRAQTRPNPQRLPHSDPIIAPAPAPGANGRKASKNPFDQFRNGNSNRQPSLVEGMSRLTVAEQPAWQEGGALVSEPEDLAAASARSKNSGNLAAASARSRNSGSSMYTDDRLPRSGTSPLSVLKPEILDDSTALAIASRITTVISDKASYRKLLYTEWTRAQRLVDISQAVLENPAVDAKSRRVLVVYIQRFAKRVGVHPRSYTLEGVKKMGKGCYAEGAYGTMHRGYYRNRNVCLKALKQDGRTMNIHLSKAVAREAILWRQLNHRNILPFYGICEIEIGLCMVSPWMRQGNLREYIKGGMVTPEERLLVARDVAEGLKYLHSYEIVHGDLKGENVLIDGVGRACIADFGLSSIDDPAIAYWSSQSRVASRGGNFVFQAPEILDKDNVDNTKASDMYAYGCVCYELYVGEEPWKGSMREVITRKLANEMPKCPEENSVVWKRSGLTPTMWSLMLATWSLQPDQRPDASKVVKQLSPMIVQDHRELEEAEEEPDAEFISRWCRGRPEDDRVSSGLRQKFNIPTLEEVEELLKLP